MYAVAKDGDCTVKYVGVAGNYLILRPRNQAYPIEVMTMQDGKTAADYLVGRVCYVGHRNLAVRPSQRASRGA